MKTYAEAVINPGPKLEYFYPKTRTWSIVPPAFDSREILERVNRESEEALAGREITQRKPIEPPSPVGVLSPFDAFLIELDLGSSSVKVYIFNYGALSRQDFPPLTSRRLISKL